MGMKNSDIRHEVDIFRYLNSLIRYFVCYIDNVFLMEIKYKL